MWSLKMVAMTRLELVTPALWVRCSNQLSYIAVNCARIICCNVYNVKPFYRLIVQNLVKWTDKPGSVENDHSSRRTITHTLKRPTRIQYGPYLRIPIWSCFWWGLPCHELLPVMRCALTAPFHPYLRFLPKKKPEWRRSTLCCTFRRLTPPRRYLAPCPMKPGLSSPASVTETSTAAIVWFTSRAHLNK